ncbi:MAG: DJ-1/PfpI family protein [Candidatus Nealsonbacteria bacterium]|nr:DJ-1/PfpI family protein [Candidatus Nealsonbacteria bacterium]
MLEKPLQGKKIAMVIAFRDFMDPEYFIPKSILSGAGASVITASTEKGLAIGADGGEAVVDYTVSEINAEDFDAVLFIGGSGMGKQLENEDFHKLAKDASSKGKVVASICIAGVLLAKAGVLKGKKATVWSSPLDKSPIRILKENGVIYKEGPVVADDKMVTASGPDAAKEFGEIIVGVLTQ